MDNRRETLLNQLVSARDAEELALVREKLSALEAHAGQRSE